MQRPAGGWPVRSAWMGHAWIDGVWVPRSWAAGLLSDEAGVDRLLTAAMVIVRTAQQAESVGDDTTASWARLVDVLVTVMGVSDMRTGLRHVDPTEHDDPLFWALLAEVDADA